MIPSHPGENRLTKPLGLCEQFSGFAFAYFARTVIIREVPLTAAVVEVIRKPLTFRAQQFRENVECRPVMTGARSPKS